MKQACLSPRDIRSLPYLCHSHHRPLNLLVSASVASRRRSDWAAASPCPSRLSSSSPCALGHDCNCLSSRHHPSQSLRRRMRSRRIHRWTPPLLWADGRCSTLEAEAEVEVVSLRSMRFASSCRFLSLIQAPSGCQELDNARTLRLLPPQTFVVDHIFSPLNGPVRWRRSPS